MQELAVAVLVSVALVAPGAEAQPRRTNILELANGAVITSVSSTYGSNWGPLNLVDGSATLGWCSAQSAPLPHSIVIELPQSYALTSVAVDTTGDQESGYPGISAKTVAVYGSTTSDSDGFGLLSTLNVPQGGHKEATLSRPVTAQWLKFVVTANWGNAEFTEVMELEGYGKPVGEPPKVDVSGVYETNYDLLRLEQDGTRVVGCYDHREGRISGNLLGRVLQGEWQEDNGQRFGTAVMVRSVQGDALNGVWYERGQLGGEWSGHRAVGKQPECTTVRGSTLAANLASRGHAVLYGVYFDSDSATLRAESEATLDEVLSVLKANLVLKLQISGHTDSTNTDAYNLQLSQRRAEAVVKWLTEHGAAAARLTARGFGKSQPVADNGTATGRALNRRVEVSTLN
jgi:outer membrane protein OmpA-like peptidoglycan-associated protein